MKVVVLGGSISCGGDTWYYEQQWATRVFNWINATFPSSRHTFQNSCKGATPSMLIAACLDQHVPAGTDLILVEVSEALGMLADRKTHRLCPQQNLYNALAPAPKPECLVLHVAVYGERCVSCGHQEAQDPST